MYNGDWDINRLELAQDRYREISEITSSWYIFKVVEVIQFNCCWFELPLNASATRKLCKRKHFITHNIQFVSKMHIWLMPDAQNGLPFYECVSLWAKFDSLHGFCLKCWCHFKTQIMYTNAIISILDKLIIFAKF